MGFRMLSIDPNNGLFMGWVKCVKSVRQNKVKWSFVSFERNLSLNELVTKKIMYLCFPKGYSLKNGNTES